MTEQLALIDGDQPARRYTLACGHQAPYTGPPARTATGWPAAQWCGDCGARRAVTGAAHVEPARDSTEELAARSGMLPDDAPLPY